MRISELRQKLKDLEDEHGDLEVVVMDDQWPEGLEHVEQWPLRKGEDIADYYGQGPRQSWSFIIHESDDPVVSAVVLGRKGYL